MARKLTDGEVTFLTERGWTLESAIREAIRTNRDLAAVDRAVAVGAEDVSLATSVLLPQLGVSATGVVIDEDRAEASFEMLRRIGLHDVVIGACVEQSDDLRFVVSSCGNNHRHIGDRTDHSERLSSVEIGETEIEHHDVEPA